MGKTILVIGGCKSGKSSYALSLANRYKDKMYLATCDPQDEEMEERVRRHREERGKEWKLVEETIEIPSVLKLCESEVLLLDCITLWISNLIMKGLDPLERTDSLLESLRGFQGAALLVSNEVGYGIVPENNLARKFRDVAGIVNQKIAGFADEVVLVTAGIPQYLKQGS